MRHAVACCRERRVDVAFVARGRRVVLRRALGAAADEVSAFFVRRRRVAAAFAWRDSAVFVALVRGSRFRARVVARLRFFDGLRFRVPCPTSLSRAAERRVLSLVCPA